MRSASCTSCRAFFQMSRKQILSLLQGETSASQSQGDESDLMSPSSSMNSQGKIIGGESPKALPIRNKRSGKPVVKKCSGSSGSDILSPVLSRRVDEG